MIIQHSNPFEEYFQFVEERQNIWYRRFVKKQSFPWTEDEVLRKAKFTNIYRELDRVTLWELAKLKQIKDPVEQLQLILLLRWCNSPLTVETLLQSHSREEFEAQLPNIRKKGYLISNAIWYGPPRGYTRETWCWPYYEKVGEIKHQIFDQIQNCTEVHTIIPELVLPHLQRIGPFMGYEMFTSMTYCPWFVWGENDWVVVGPGCKPGLEYLLGYGVDHKTEVSELGSVFDYVKEELKRRNQMVWLNDYVSHVFEISCDDPVIKRYPEPKFTLRTLEHSLCEFRKYVNIRDGGPIRRKYRPK